MIKFIRKMFIPRNIPYCHHRFKQSKKYGICAKPCRNWTMKYNKDYDCKMEYCEYLKSFLDVQDQVKDCEVE